MSKSPKLTKNQSIVLDALVASDTPITAYEILDLERVRSCGLKAPLTIYRALDKLLTLGLVHRIESLNAYLACCDHKGHAEPAGFAICEVCRKAIELRIADCGDHLTMHARSTGFRVDSVRVEMIGRCRDCQES